MQNYQVSNNTNNLVTAGYICKTKHFIFTKPDVVSVDNKWDKFRFERVCVSYDGYIWHK